jgi:hypothetical protein
MPIFIEVKGVKYTIIGAKENNEYLVQDPNGRHGYLTYNGRIEIKPSYIKRIIKWFNANRGS